jgi:hypothetical protein
MTALPQGGGSGRASRTATGDSEIKSHKELRAIVIEIPKSRFQEIGTKASRLVVVHNRPPPSALFDHSFLPSQFDQDRNKMIRSSRSKIFGLAV